jgi:hypothetical protein
MAAGVLGSLAVAYFYHRSNNELMDFEQMSELDRRLYNQLKEEVGEINDL